MDLPRPEIICASAPSRAELEDSLAKLLSHLQNDPNTSLRSIARAANTRCHQKYRTVLIASSVADLMGSLSRNEFSIHEAPLSPNRIGFMFCAQGCQYLGMGKDLYSTFPAFRSALDHYEQIYHTLTGTTFREGIWESGLFWTVYSQPVLLCFQLALVELWKSFGISPAVVMGHSFGEYAAAVVAGGLSIEDALTVSVHRFDLIASTMRNGAWTMIGVKAHEAQVGPLMDKFMATVAPGQEGWWLDVAAVNSPSDVLVGGPKSAIDAFEQFCRDVQLVTRETNSPIAFHSRAMDPIMEEFQKVLNGVTHNPRLTTECVSATLGTYMTGGEYSTKYWLTHLRERMHCGQALMGIWSKCKTLIEIGPREVLVHKAAENIGGDHGGIICPTMRRSNTDWYNFYYALGQLFVNGVEIDWGSWLDGDEDDKSEQDLELGKFFCKLD